MQTDTVRGQTAAVKFALLGVAWSLGFFGALRLSWTEATVLLPLTRVEAALAIGLFGTPALPVEVTLACSGADALALCLGAVFAYPVPWRRRIVGAAGGVALILGLNILRIGTLGRVVASPTWFNALHVYVWPAVLLLAIAGYVFGWMRLADRPLSTPAPTRSVPHPTRRFVLLTAAFLLVFIAASPFYLESTGVLWLAAFVARAAAATLGIVGVSAHAAGNVMWTSRGGFLVTQECISTPLIPVYLAAIFIYSTTWRRMALGLAAALPLFIALGIVRLLVVALPGAVLGSPLFLVHAFYQLLLGVVVVVLAALWRHSQRAALQRSVAGVTIGVLAVCLLASLSARVVTFAAGGPLDDPQGALAFLPAFQVGLYLALWVAAFAAAGWARFFAGLAVLELTQAAALLVLHVVASHPALMPHVRNIRGWAVAGPLLIVTAVVSIARPRR